MKSIRMLTQTGLGVSALCFISAAQAGIPVWSFTPDSKFPPKVAVSATGTATVKYVVSNNSSKVHNLVIKPITGITQAGPCAVGPKGSANATCVLTLNIKGSSIPANGISGGPVLCQTSPNGQPNPNQCYQPSNGNGLAITVSTTPPPVPTISLLMAGGGYVGANRIERPLLVQSLDGDAWVYPESITAPVFTPTNTFPFSDSSSFNAASCSGTICVAVGAYLGTDDNTHPLLTQTTDKGTTWIYPESITNPVFVDHPITTSGSSPTQLSSASCLGSTCVTVGTYSDNSSVQRPMLASTNNSGTSWSYSESITSPVFSPNPFVSDGKLNSVSCSETICIAGGAYNGGGAGRPLLAQSTNKGATWQYPQSIVAPVFTPVNTNPFVDDGTFNGVSCSGNNCIAAGSYQDGSAIQRPLLAVSENAGASWSYPQSINAPVFTPTNTNPYQQLGIFNNASCSGQNCIAVGSYQDGSAIQRPLLASSQDGGLTWSYPQVINSPTFTDHPFAELGNLTGASCIDSTCIAVGYYTDSTTKERPLIARSTDGGLNWQYQESATEPTFTPTSVIFNSGYFTNISCVLSTCIATGQFSGSGRPGPLVAISKDQGATWSYPTSATNVVFIPNDTFAFDGGFLSGSGISATASYSIPHYLQNIFNSSDGITH